MTQNLKTSLKKSNIPWIGEIPQDWRVKRLKFLAKIETGYTPPKADEENYSENGLPWIKPDNLDGLSYLVDSSEKISAKGLSGNPIAHKNDILVCCIGTVGKMGIAGCDLTFNQQINSVQFGNDVDKEFGKFLILSSQEEHLRASQVVVVPILNKTKQSNIYFPLPPLSTQTLIANFLDQKTTEIKKFIENKRKLIELLKEQKQSIIHRAVTKGIDPNAKMKESGIPWIGEIPEDWEVRKMKHIFSGINNGTTANQIEGKSDFPVTRIETISTGEINWDKVGYINGEDVNNSYKLRKNDFLLSHINSFEYVGNSACYEDDTMPLYHGMNLLRMSPREIIYPKFAKYILKSFYFRFYIQTICKPAINQVSVPTGAIKDIIVFLPSLVSQKSIVSYIENEISQIDSAIVKIEQEITLIEEYQTSLIYQAVTGKISIS